MKTYCEILISKNYLISEIPEKVLVKLSALLNQIGDNDFVQLEKAINNELRRHIPPFFAEAGQEIVFCKKCGAVGKQRHEDVNRYDTFTIEKCQSCNGEGTRVKKYFIQYEAIDENKRKRFATDGYPRCDTNYKMVYNL